MNKYHLIKQPRAVRKAKLDNLALVPASLLPFKEQWQDVANSKPGEHVLIVLPEMEKRPRRVLERVAAELREKGHQVTTISAEEFGQPAEDDTPAAIQPRLF
jgi:hypothetical protein